MCGTGFDRRKVPAFKCPSCGEELTYETETKFDYVWVMLSLYCFPILLYFLGVHNFFILVGAPIFLFVVGMTISWRLFPRQVVPKYAGLRLKDRTAFRQDHPPD